MRLKLVPQETCLKIVHNVYRPEHVYTMNVVHRKSATPVIKLITC